MKDQGQTPKTAELIRQRLTERSKLTAPQVGDYLKVTGNHPDFFTRFTHGWDDSIQTGGTPGNSIYMNSNGTGSYSGSLDSGVKLTDLILTDETRAGMFWIFKDGISGGGRGVDFQAECRVFILREGSDISGLWDYKKFKEDLFKKTLPQTTSINGNGHEYKKPLPAFLFLNDSLGEWQKESIERLTGLQPKPYSSGMQYQPETFEQFTNIMLVQNWDYQRFGNSVYDNHIVIGWKERK